MNENVLVVVAVLFVVAFLVESLVEAIFGTPFDKIPKLTPYKWTLMYVAFIVGIAGAFNYHFDLPALLSTFLGKSSDPTTFGQILTGLAIGRGSNYVHDLFQKWFKPVTAPESK